MNHYCVSCIKDGKTSTGPFLFRGTSLCMRHTKAQFEPDEKTPEPEIDLEPEKVTKESIEVVSQITEPFDGEEPAIVWSDE